MIPLRLAALACCASLVGSPALVAADVIQLDNKPTLKGDVVGIDATSVKLKDKEGKETLVPLKGLAEVKLGNPLVAPAPGVLYDEVELTDGSLLRTAHDGTLLKKGEKEPLLAAAAAVKVEKAGEPKLTVPMSTVFYWLRNANAPGVRGDWKLRVVEKKGKRDQFVLYDKEAGFTPTEGTVLGGTEKTIDKEVKSFIQFEDSTGNRRDYPLERLNGGLLLIQPQQTVLPPTAGKVYDVFGNVLLATAVAIDDKNGKVKVTTVSGAVAEYDSLAALVRVDFAQGNVKLLEELEAAIDAPAAEPGTPYQPYLVGATRDGKGLRVGGKVYAKGLWVAPDTSLKYKLGGNYQAFKAVVGIDDALPVVPSKVTVVVEVDGQKVLSHTFDPSPKAKKPLELNINIKGAQELKITVEREALFSGEGLSFGDAKLQK